MNYQDEINKIKALKSQLSEMNEIAHAKVEALLHAHGDCIEFTNPIGERWFDNMTKIEWRKEYHLSKEKKPIITFCNGGTRNTDAMQGEHLYKLLSLIENNI